MNEISAPQSRAQTLTRFLPLAGVGYAVLTIAGDRTIGPFPDASAAPTQLSTFYTQHGAGVRVGGQLMILAAYCLCLFGVAIWLRLRAAEAPAVVSGLMLVCTSVGVLSELSGAGSYVLLGSVGGDHTVAPAALQALQIGSQFGAGGGTLLMLALFAAGVFGGAIPRWLSWAALALGVGAITQFGFLASMLFLLWAAVVGVVLTVRGMPRSSGEAAARAHAALA